MLTVELTLACKKHPTYNGKKKRKGPCKDCDAIWNARNDPTYWTAEIFDREKMMAEIKIVEPVSK